MSWGPTAASASSCRRHLQLAAALLAASVWTSTARADVDDVVLLPTVVQHAGDRDSLSRPEPEREPELARFARQLDWILGESAQDLDLLLDVSARVHVGAEDLGENRLLERARDSWVVSPRISRVGSLLQVRILAVAPGSRVVLVRSQIVSEEELDVTAMVMLRDLVQAGGGGTPASAAAAPSQPTVGETALPAPSAGRAILALNGATLGGYVGFSLQRASGSDDARLLYPLLALGTGVGLGASMIAASEWDIGLGDAWYLSAGAWWPAASGLLLAQSYDVTPKEDRYVYGLVGASAGMTLATVALSFDHMSEGGAALTHSGGAWGTVLGGIVQLYARGSTDDTPTRGMGYGAAIGVLGAGALATQIELSASRILLVDLSASLGAMTGAALASPTVFGEERSAAENRIWLASMAGGTVAGAAIGFVITRPDGSSPAAAQSAYSLGPFAGPIAPAALPGGEPAYGAGLRGTW